MQGTNRADIQGGGLFQDGLHLRAVFADDAEVVPACFACPLGRDVQRAEFTEGVSGKEYLVRFVPGHDDLGPVHHGRGDKREAVTPQAELVALLDDDSAIGVIRAEESLHHREGFLGCDDNRIGECVHEQGNGGAVIGLHVVDKQEVRLASVQYITNALQPSSTEVGIHCIHHGDLFIYDDIGIVAHAFRNGIQRLEEVKLVVVYTHIADIISNKHAVTPWRTGPCRRRRGGTQSLREDLQISCQERCRLRDNRLPRHKPNRKLRKHTS